MRVMRERFFFLVFSLGGRGSGREGLERGVDHRLAVAWMDATIRGDTHVYMQYRAGRVRTNLLGIACRHSIAFAPCAPGMITVR